MKAHVHRRMSEAVARELWPDANCEVVVGASVTMDAVKTVPRHHPTNDTHNVGCIQDWTRTARQEYLEAGLSDQCQIQLGNVFHLVQDGFISSQRLEAHNDLEGQVSRHLAQFTFYGIDGESLTTEYEVDDFVRDEVRPLEDPEQILARAFRVCLSIGRAVTSPKADFGPGVRANDLITEAERLIQEAESECNKWMDTDPAKTSKASENYFSVQISEMEAASLEVSDRASVLQRIMGSHRQEARRYKDEIESLRKQKAKVIRDSSARNERRLNGLLELAGQGTLALQELKDFLPAGYQPQYESAQRNARWLGIDTQEFLTPGELESFIARHEDRLCNLAAVLGNIARQLAVSVDLRLLKALDSYPSFRADLSSQTKTEEIPQSVIEQLMLVPVSPTQEPDDVELSVPIAAPVPTSSRLSNWQLAVLGGLGASLLVVFSCLAVLILLAHA